MPSVPQVVQQISQEQNQQQNGPNLSSLHNSLPVPHSGNPTFSSAGDSFTTASRVRRKEEESMKFREHVKNRNKRLIKKENLQKEVVLPELLTFTVEKYMPDLADAHAAAAAEALLPEAVLKSYQS